MRKKLGTFVLAATAVATIWAGAAPAGASAASQLKAKLVPLTDVGTGWSTTSPNGSKAVNASCLKDLRMSFSHVTRASVAFKYGAGIPKAALQEDVVSGSAIPAKFTKLQTALNSCHQGNITVNGIKYTASFTPVPSATVGVASSAYELTLKAKGLTYKVDAIVFQNGTYLADVFYVDLGKHDNGQVQVFAGKALLLL